MSLFSVKGCIKRSEWWALTISTNVVVVSYVCGLLVAAFEDSSGILAMLFLLPAILICIYVQACAYVQRMHDRNKSGYWALLYFVPIANLWLFVQCGFLPSVENSEYNE